MSSETIDRSVDLIVEGKPQRFNIDDPILPEWVKKRKLTAGNYPYDKRLPIEEYEEQLELLQIELVKVQFWLKAKNRRIICLFEGRDAAGKGGTISAIHENLNPRSARTVALTAPSARENGQWYFQRYASHFPTFGELVLYDRSWYNRAGVEPVMGFCTPEEHAGFLKDTPRFEQLLVDSGVNLFKFYLDIAQETQLERFHDRRHNPLKRWKLSDMDIAALTKWDAYTSARDLMLEKTHTADAPWIVVRANDKRRTRLNVIRHILNSLDYDDKDASVIGKADDKILGIGAKILK